MGLHLALVSSVLTTTEANSWGSVPSSATFVVADSTESLQDVCGALAIMVRKVWKRRVARLEIHAHGRAGTLYLGPTITMANAVWFGGLLRSFMIPYGYIDAFNCNLAQNASARHGSNGEDFCKALAKASQCHIIASDTKQNGYTVKLTTKTTNRFNNFQGNWEGHVQDFSPNGRVLPYFNIRRLEEYDFGLDKSITPFESPDHILRTDAEVNEAMAKLRFHDKDFDFEAHPTPAPKTPKGYD